MHRTKQSEKRKSLHGDEKQGTLSELQETKASHLGSGSKRAASKGMMERSPSV
jgi:hypothetical protein